MNSSGHHMTGQNGFGYCSKKCPYQCYSLFKQGPCQSNHWLVANEFANKTFAECKMRLCQAGEIHFNDECHKIDSNSVCGDSQVLLLNLFGEGNIFFTNMVLRNNQVQ